MCYWLGPPNSDGDCMGLLVVVNGEVDDNLVVVGRKMSLRLLRVIEVVKGMDVLAMVVVDLMCVGRGVSR